MKSGRVRFAAAMLTVASASSLMTLGLTHAGGVLAGSVMCVAPLDDGSFKYVTDGDADNYDGTVYVCADGRWIADPNYGM